MQTVGKLWYVGETLDPDLPEWGGWGEAAASALLLGGACGGVTAPVPATV